MRLQINANGDGVRRALKQQTEILLELGVLQDLGATSEIVLAELLNNIVEHAYSDTGEGQIDLEFEFHPQGLDAKVTDYGKPMPGYRMPQKRAANIDVDRQDLPEGGFGWFLIHELVENLNYVRQGNRNIVRFSIAFG